MRFSWFRPYRHARVGLLAGILFLASSGAANGPGFLTPATVGAALDRESLSVALHPHTLDGLDPRQVEGEIVYMALPEGKEAADVRLEPGAAQAWRAGGLPDRLPGRLPGRVAGADEATSAWPDAPGATLVYSGWLRGQAVAGIRVRAAARASDGTTRFWPNPRLIVTLRPATRPAGVLTPRLRGTAAEDDLARLARALVANPEELAAARDPLDAPAARARAGALTPVSYDADNNSPRMKPSLDGSPVEMVIITNDALSAEYQRLADWRTRTGRYTVIRTVDWIRTNYPGGVDLVGEYPPLHQGCRDAVGHGLRAAGRRHGRGAGPLRAHHLLRGRGHPHRSLLPVPGRQLERERQRALRRGAERRLAGRSNAGDSVDLLPDVCVAPRAAVHRGRREGRSSTKRSSIERTPPGHANYIPTILCLAEVLQPSNWTSRRPRRCSTAPSWASRPSATCRPTFRVTRLYENCTDPRWYGAGLPEQKNPRSSTR